MPPLARACAATEAPPTLVDALALAPAAARVLAALGPEDRKNLRLAHTSLRDAVGEATTKLEANFMRAAARPPTARRWPRLVELAIFEPDLAALGALGSEMWHSLRSLWFCAGLDFLEPSARALAAALRRMPALRALKLQSIILDEAAAALFRSKNAPRLRAITVTGVDLAPAAVRALAATGWRLEELDLRMTRTLGAAGVAALVAAPAFAIRRLNLARCKLDAAALLALADAPWPLEELDFSHNDVSAAAAGPALAALSRHAGLRKLNFDSCRLSAAAFKALVEASWPALTSLHANFAKAEFAGPHALGAAAFAGFPALEELDLQWVELRDAGARLLAGGRWARLVKLDLHDAQLGDAGLAALARGEWPALQVLNVRSRRNAISAPPTLEGARRWAPALVTLHA
jgi:hypothetical protein